MSIRRLALTLLSAIIAITLTLQDSTPAAAGQAGSPTPAAASAAKKKKKSKSGKSKRSKTSKSKSRTGKKKSSSKKSRRKSKSSAKKRGSAKKRSTAGRRNATPAPKPEVAQNDSLTLMINEALIRTIPADHNPGGLRVNSVRPDARSRTARLSLNENFTYLPVTRELIDGMRNSVRRALPDSLHGYDVKLTVNNRDLSYYINKVDPLPAAARQPMPVVRPRTPYASSAKGMSGDNVALWHSHGRYFKPGAGSWYWQRPVLFQTLEDIYTMSYILPFVTPMVENAGGYVFLPRERDVNRNEVIVDNDLNEGGGLYSQPYYKEIAGDKAWTTGEEEGFIYDLPDFRDTENPFENGTYRQTLTVKGGKESVAAWYADIPEDGEYAVYVSYKSLPNSTEDALYTVNYSGGSREFIVNQTMGGGTWIYLGTFPFRSGYSDTEPAVTLSNLSSKEAGRVLTADAVKIGGGMGNIARSNRRSDIYYDPSTPVDEYAAADTEDESAADDEEDDAEAENDEENTEDAEGDLLDHSGEEDPKSDEAQKPKQQPVAPKGPAPTFRISGMPRFLEGARYWLQWAGAPESVYSPYHGSDDYKDDYTSRGNWVNWLAGGSRVLPEREGLNVPIDVVMALHSDAGKRSDDSFVGTLGIYYTNNGASYADGTPRINSRMLADLLMRQITSDVRQTYEPSWTRRSMWDKSYVEARVPEVPTALIELMSHQNFADMQYGLDPAFRFTVGRAIYKALGRFVAQRKGREFVVQPLPPKEFAIRRERKGVYRLSWEPTADPLEPTAAPKKYVVMERSEGDLGFHKVAETTSTHWSVKIDDRKIHSFRIIAANDGGISFPSETLSLREAPDGGKPVLVVNGFTRVSGPEHFSSDGRAGFLSEDDFGVPYIRDISYSGPQTEFRRSAGDGFGRSSSSDIQRVIAGNTFDYPAVHGEAIAAAGRGFVSASALAVEKGKVKLSDYKTIDLILGKQKTTVVGRGHSGARFTALPEELATKLDHFVRKGGSLLVSGQYLSSDANDYRSTQAARDFVSGTLGVLPDTIATTPRTRSGKISMQGVSGFSPADYNYSSTLNDKQYIVERPDMLVPAAEAIPFMTFTDNGYAAGVLTARGHGHGRTASMSVPFESITDAAARNVLMSELLQYLEHGN